MSDFCREDDACHARVAMGEGCSEVVVSVCKIVKEGDSAAINTDPLVYLHCT
jgi:hypothetical protein